MTRLWPRRALTSAALIASLSLSIDAEPPPPDTPDHRQAAMMPAEHHHDREPFRPSIHGFKFHNSFTGSPIPPQYRGLAEMVGLDISQAPTTYGLCGGMSASAADFYLAGRDMPARSTPPDDGALFDYLSARQLDSLGPALVMALKFADWMNYADHRAPTTTPPSPISTPSTANKPATSNTPAPKSTATQTPTSASNPSTARAPRPRPDIAAKTAEELPAIYDKLDNNELVILGLVLVKTGDGMLWDNHQVLAYGYDRDDSGATIKIYDPNYPGDDNVVITVSPCEPGSTAVKCELRPTDRRSRPVRGIFEMPYTPRTPPESLTR